MLFGGKLPPGSETDKKHFISLLAENRKNALSLTLSRSHSSVFHAGVIGQGLKRKSPTEFLSRVTHHLVLDIGIIYYDLCCIL